MAELDLSLTPNPSSLSLSSTTLTPLLTASTALLDTLPGRPSHGSSPSWSVSKTSADGRTIVYTAKHLNEPWLGRVTRNTKITYEQALEGLWEKKAETEKKIVGKEQDTFEVFGKREIEGGEFIAEDVRKMLHIQAFAAREFYETVFFHEFAPAPFDDADSKPRRNFIVISKPKEGAVKDPKDVRGVYTCVERMWETEDGGLDLYFACTSDAGGSIPRWVQNMAMPGQILSDGVEFIKYYEGLNK